MTSSSSGRSAKRPASKRSVALLLEPDGREPRGARRKRETRSRLLGAALNLMAERGMAGVAINEITDAADVGFGSFYNHFESKEAIYAALIDQVFEDFADALDRLVVGVDDPAEVLSICIRHTLLRARREPVWGQFLIREGLSIQAMGRGLGQRLLRDVMKGVASKRFASSDPMMTILSAGTMILGATVVELDRAMSNGRGSPSLRQLGFTNDDIPERTITTLLTMLGLSHAEAEKIAHRSLPTLESRLHSDP